MITHLKIGARLYTVEPCTDGTLPDEWPPPETGRHALIRDAVLEREGSVVTLAGREHLTAEFLRRVMEAMKREGGRQMSETKPSYGSGPTEHAGPFNTLAQEVVEINRANGWNVPKPEDWTEANRVPTFLALIHSEVSEALEAFRKGDPVNFAEEVADIQIRLLDLAGGMGLDLDGEVRRKLERNKGRGFRHGGKRV